MFPEWTQEAYWDLIDTQRARKVVATEIKKATQVNLDAAGGVRPLTMLEEFIKAIKGPIASRKNQAPIQLPIGTVYRLRTSLEKLNIERPRRSYK